MDETFMEECLTVHQGLVDVERKVHAWLCGLTGIEVVGEAGEPAPWDRPGTDHQSWREANPLPAHEDLGPEPQGQDAYEAHEAEAPEPAPDVAEAPPEVGIAEPIDWMAQGDDAEAPAEGQEPSWIEVPDDEAEPAEADEPSWYTPEAEPAPDAEHEGDGANRPPRPDRLASATSDDNPWADTGDAQ